jgi:hypothetical protein
MCFCPVKRKSRLKPAKFFHRPGGDGRRFIVRANEKLGAFVELERQVLTVTFYLASIDDECAGGLS